MHAFLRQIACLSQTKHVGFEELVEQTIDRATDLLLVLLRDDPIQKQLYVELEIVNLLIRIMSHCQLLAAKENAVNVPKKSSISRSTHKFTHIQIVAAAPHFSCPHGSNPFSSVLSIESSHVLQGLNSVNLQEFQAA